MLHKYIYKCEAIRTFVLKGIGGRGKPFIERIASMKICQKFCPSIPLYNRVNLHHTEVQRGSVLNLEGFL